jgi:hypothetical protein
MVVLAPRQQRHVVSRPGTFGQQVAAWDCGGLLPSNLVVAASPTLALSRASRMIERMERTRASFAQDRQRSFGPLLRTGRKAAYLSQGCFGCLLGRRATSAPANVLRVMFDPQGVRPFVANSPHPASGRTARAHKPSIRPSVRIAATTPSQPRSGILPLPFVRTALALLLACSSTTARASGPRTSIRSASLDVLPKGQWLRTLGYREQDIHAITLAPATGAPLVEVEVAGVRMALLLDTGTARGFMLTDRAPDVRYHVVAHVVERDASGRPRGESEAIRVDSLDVLGTMFSNVEGTRSDWRLFSSVPFAGTVGLAFFKIRRLTLDYATLTAAVSVAPLPDSLDPRHYLVLDLIAPPQRQGHILYVRGIVNGRRAIVHLDTGYSASWIDSAFALDLPRTEWPSVSYPVRRGVPLDLGGSTFVLDGLREQAIQRGPGLDSPVALSLGSDFLSRFVLTIDLRAKKLVLARTR